MPKRKAITKQVRTTTNNVKPKGSQKPQSRKSGGQPKKGTHCQKCSASDGSDGSDDTESSEARSQPLKRSRRSARVDVKGKENNEEVEEEESEEDVEHIADGDGGNVSEDIEQVSSL
jgi:hypothetical protein